MSNNRIADTVEAKPEQTRISFLIGEQRKDADSLQKVEAQIKSLRQTKAQIERAMLMRAGRIEEAKLVPKPEASGG